MSQLTNYQLPTIKDSYDITLEQSEIQTLGSYIAYVMEHCQDVELILEMACMYQFMMRFKARLLQPKKRKLSLMPYEAIAIRRLLESSSAHFPHPTAGVYLGHIYSKLCNALGNVG